MLEVTSEDMKMFTEVSLHLLDSFFRCADSSLKLILEHMKGKFPSKFHHLHLPSAW